jgi:hypothetical protein
MMTVAELDRGKDVPRLAVPGRGAELCMAVEHVRHA